MEQVSKDADKRYKDKLIRKEKAETFRTRATKAFRRGEYEKALTLYDKVNASTVSAALVLKLIFLGYRTN